MVDVNLKRKYYTFEEYLHLEEQATEKHEYHDGEILQISGGTVEHSIVSNLEAW